MLHWGIVSCFPQPKKHKAGLKYRGAPCPQLRFALIWPKYILFLDTVTSPARGSDESELKQDIQSPSHDRWLPELLDLRAGHLCFSWLLICVLVLDLFCLVFTEDFIAPQRSQSIRESLLLLDTNYLLQYYEAHCSFGSVGVLHRWNLSVVPQFFLLWAFLLIGISSPTRCAARVQVSHLTSLCFPPWWANKNTSCRIWASSSSAEILAFGVRPLEKTC